MCFYVWKKASSFLPLLTAITLHLSLHFFGSALEGTKSATDVALLVPSKAPALSVPSKVRRCIREALSLCTCLRKRLCKKRQKQERKSPKEMQEVYIGKVRVAERFWEVLAKRHFVLSNEKAKKRILNLFVKIEKENPFEIKFQFITSRPKHTTSIRWKNFPNILSLIHK